MATELKKCRCGNEFYAYDPAWSFCDSCNANKIVSAKRAAAPKKSPKPSVYEKVQKVTADYKNQSAGEAL